MSWTPEELAHCRVLLGVEVSASAEVVQKAYLQKSYALIRGGASEDDKEQLKIARDALLEILRAGEQQQLATARVAAQEAQAQRQVAQLVAEAEKEEAAQEEKDPGPFHPASFDSAVVNAAFVPLVAGLGIAVGASPLGFLLNGFFVWIHEFGHATAAWMTGRRALPLPFGWTPI